jgi:O-acetyl-ADP-ribose deacetylase
MRSSRLIVLIGIAESVYKTILPIKRSEHAFLILDAHHRIDLMTTDKISEISAIKEDITLQKVDAIVNAANNSLLGGGGVDGAIHLAAGPGLLEECRKLNGCPNGEARITGGYNLPARFVIHTVGPVWHGGNEGEAETLAMCYRNCLEVALQQGIKTIAFPSISTGAYGFPVELASRIAVREVKRILEGNDSIEKVVFVCFNQTAYECYMKLIEAC